MWAGAGILLAAVVAVTVWLSVSGARMALRQPSGARPANLPPPSEAVPITIWSETRELVVNLQGDIRLGYEKLPSLQREKATVRVTLSAVNPANVSQPVLQLHFHRPLPGQSGQLQLGALLAAVNQQQAISRQLLGEGRLTIALGDRDPGKPFRPLSNEVAMACEFR
jgi:hypothetical protein